MAASPNRTRWLFLGLLVVLPLFLRLWPIQHGFPTTAHVPDTHIVRSALGMAKDKHPVPPVAKYSTYPNLLPYMLLPVYAADFGIRRVTGQIAGKGEYEKLLKEKPATAHLPARILVALFGALTPLVVFGAARAMGLGVGAWFAAWLVASGLLHVQFSTHERPWVPMVFFLALTAWPAALYGKSGAARHLFLAGIAAALSFSCHQSGLFALGLCGAAWLLGPLGWSGAALKERLRVGVMCVGLFLVIGIAIGHPYYLFYGMPDTSQVAAGDSMGSNAVNVGGQAWVFTVRFETMAKLVPAFLGYDPVLALFGAAGLLLAFARKEMRAVAIFTAALAALLFTGQGDHTRYLLPIGVLLTWPAGALLEKLWSGPAKYALLVVMALPLVQALRLGHVLRQEDTRAMAAEQLTKLEGSVAVDMWGPELPLSMPSLERLSRFRNLTGREAHRVLYYEHDVEPPGRAGLDAFPVEAIFDYALHQGGAWIEKSDREELGTGDPTEALLSLGLTHILITDRYPGDVVPILLDPRVEPGGDFPKMAPLRVESEPDWIVSPGDDPVDASLPSELAFPLTQLWKVERPGPVLRLYRLKTD